MSQLKRGRLLRHSGHEAAASDPRRQEAAGATGRDPGTRTGSTPGTRPRNPLRNQPRNRPRRRLNCKTNPNSHNPNRCNVPRYPGSRSQACSARQPASNPLAKEVVRPFESTPISTSRRNCRTSPAVPTRNSPSLRLTSPGTTSAPPCGKVDSPPSRPQFLVDSQALLSRWPHRSFQKRKMYAGNIHYSNLVYDGR
jgi:hypothetical protein